MRVLAATLAVALCAWLSQATADSGARPPQGAVLLFDGKDTSAFTTVDGKPAHWKIVDGALEATSGGDIQTKQPFEDYALHLEFRTPQPAPDQVGQDRGNSGVKLAGRYEIQILESHGQEPRKDNCGAIYRQKAADRNMASPPGQWQTYDIVFRAPRFDASGRKTEHARVTVTWNGQKVHDDIEITGPTRAGQTEESPGPAPILLQDHGHPVQFRNIWVVPTKDIITH